ncbi:Adenylate cyclase [Diplonema papillatum]|nr:Adenylate cyclase [Diplonema papillatum]
MRCLTRLRGSMTARLLRADDSEDVAIRKRIVVLMQPTIALTGLILSVLLWRTHTAYISAFTALATSFIIMYCVHWNQFGENAMRVYMMTMLIAVALADYDAASHGYERIWQCSLLLIDVALLFKMNQHTCVGLVVLVLVWVFVVACESAIRFGLYDLVGEDRDKNAMCDCDNLPCARGVDGLQPLASALFLVPLNYGVIRRFADETRHARRRIEAASDAATKIAYCLGTFDLIEAQQILDAAGSELPDEISRPFLSIISVLTKYRPYLPNALFTTPRHGEEAVLQEAPGTTTPHAAIVFTDIQSSTLSWSLRPDAMKKALQVHNSILRAALREYHGYEVKTIGDAFMVAFPSLHNAVDFGLAVQKLLYDATWPAALLELPHCEYIEEAWKGLRIRVGVSVGDVTVEKNEVSDRLDYFGPTVNKAARLEAACPPGAVAVCEDVLQKNGRQSPANDNFDSDGPISSKSGACTNAVPPDTVVFRRENVPLKGMPNANLLLLIPDTLRKRAESIKLAGLPNVRQEPSPPVLNIDPEIGRLPPEKQQRPKLPPRSSSCRAPRVDEGGQADLEDPSSTRNKSDVSETSRISASSLPATVRNGSRVASRSPSHAVDSPRRQPGAAHHHNHEDQSKASAWVQRGSGELCSESSSHVLRPCKDSLQPIAYASGFSLSSSSRRDIMFSKATLGRVDVRTASSLDTAAVVSGINDSMSVIIQALNRSGGQVVCVVGSTLTSSWNVSQRLASHVENAFRFADILHEGVVRVGMYPMHVSLCTAMHASVSIGTGDQKFMSVVSSSVPLAQRVAALAIEINAFCLYALASQSVLPSFLRGQLQHIQNWDIVHSTADSATRHSIYAYASGTEGEARHRNFWQLGNDTNMEASISTTWVDDQSGAGSVFI